MYYKLLIVDDEKEIRDGLRTIVDWKRVGFECIGEACNGQEAMEFIEKTDCPDVILTDIRMPIMDGLDLINEAKKKHADIQFLILSGYDYFEYAKKAIEFGVFGYILKPTKLEEVYEKFSLLKDKLDDIQKKNLIHEKGLNLIKDNCIKDLINHNYADKMEIIEHLHQAGVFIDSMHCCVSIIKLLNVNDNESINKAEVDIGKLTCNSLKSIKAIDDSGHMVYILVDEEMNNKALSDVSIEELTGKIICLVRRYGMDCSIGTGNIMKGIDNVSVSYKQALHSLGKRFFKGLNKHIKFSLCTEDTIPLDYPSDYEKNLNFCIENVEKTRASEVINELFSKKLSDERLDTEQVHKVCLEMIAVISRHCRNIFRRIEKNMDENGITYKDTGDFETLAQLKEWFKKRIYLMIDLILDLRENNSGRVVSHIKGLVNNKYHEQITLNSIANELYMNPDYLSRLFKKETGESFIDFLTNYRIEKAKQFLSDVSCKSYEVGFRVGYKDASYFTKTFKRVTGMTITEFREIALI